MKRVGQLLELFGRMGEESERNIVSPVKPIPQPFHAAMLKEGARTAENLPMGSYEELEKVKKKSNH
jgi:hypothetical protein